MTTKLTRVGLEVFRKVGAATRAGRWYRAERAGERPSLASLHEKGLVKRQAWRTGKSSRDNAYEYKVNDAIMDEVHRRETAETKAKAEGVDPLTVECPRCKAAPLEPCQSLGPDSYSRGAPLKRPHAERYEAARAARAGRA